MDARTAIGNLKVIAWLAFVLVVVFTSVPAPVLASFCTAHGDSLQDGDVVFSGTVLDIIHDNSIENDTVDVVLFRVLHIWRGASQSRLVVYAGSGRDCGVGNCGYRFQVGQSYLVFAYSQSAQLTTNGSGAYATPLSGFIPTPTPIPSGPLTTDKCSRTELLSAAGPDLRSLGPGYLPLPAAGSGLPGLLTSPISYLLVGLAPALVAVGFILRRLARDANSR